MDLAYKERCDNVTANSCRCVWAMTYLMPDIEQALMLALV